MRCHCAAVCTWTIQGDAEQYKLSKARQEIWQVVEAADEPFTPTYVADALGKSFNTVKKTMWEMSRDGQLSATGNGRYSTVTSNPGNPSNPGANTVTKVTEVTPPASNANGHLWWEHMAEPEADFKLCIHGFPGGKDCYLCDPNHEYRKSDGAVR